LICRYKKLVVNRIMTDAFVEILEWDDYYVLPETLAMDAKRIIALRDAVERMAVSTGVILLVRGHFVLKVPLSGEAKETPWYTAF
jgi:hypothetical protein